MSKSSAKSAAPVRKGAQKAVAPSSGKAAPKSASTQKTGRRKG